MPPTNAPLPRPSPPLTLVHIMAAIAALALAFVSLPVILSAALAVSACGILALQGLRLPLITDGGGVRRWLPWAFWSLLLTACPIAILVVFNVYNAPGLPAPGSPRLWAVRVVDGLFCAQLGVSVVASVSAVVLTRGWARILPWAAILAIGAFTAMIVLGANMALTGEYL